MNILCYITLYLYWTSDGKIKFSCCTCLNPTWNGGGANLAPPPSIDHLLCSEGCTYELQTSWVFHLLSQLAPEKYKDVHIVVPLTYLLLSYSKFEWAENAAVQACTKKLTGKQICCTTKWFLWKLDNLSHLYLF